MNHAIIEIKQRVKIHAECELPTSISALLAFGEVDLRQRYGINLSTVEGARLIEVKNNDKVIHFAEDADAT